MDRYTRLVLAGEYAEQRAESGSDWWQSLFVAIDNERTEIASQAWQPDDDPPPYM